jgi:hypothetical protein
MNARSVSGEQSSSGLITTIAGSTGISEAFRATQQGYPSSSHEVRHQVLRDTVDLRPATMRNVLGQNSYETAITGFWPRVRDLT